MVYHCKKAEMCRGLWKYLIILILNLHHSSSCPDYGKISVYLPRNQKLVMAEVKIIGEELVAIVDDMILGDVHCEQNDDKSFTQVVELKGDFADIKGMNGDLDSRMLDLIEKKPSTRWPHSVIYYEIKGGFPSVMVDAIRNAAWIWTHNSPMRFIESSTAGSRVKVVPDSEERCLSYLGRRGGLQSMSLAASGACNLGRIVHEFGHSMGWNHEHLRPDRDDFITVEDDHILLGYQSSYEMVFDNHYGAHPYDYGSVMHYPPVGFSQNGEKVINVVKDKFQSYKESFPNELPKGEIGQRFFLSTLDKQMSYTYLTECIPEDDSTDCFDSDAEWVAAPWGGCKPQCVGPSYRERLVNCRCNGQCVKDSMCSGSTKPPTRKACELEPGNLNVTFDEEEWWEVGSMMQNVAMYDQYEWNIWSGDPPALEDTGEKYTPERTKGPEGDSSSTIHGRYLWFSSWTPVKKGDQAWYESPVLGTTRDQICEVSFDWFIVGSGAKLQVELVSCEDCWDVTVLWSTTHNEAAWSNTALMIPSIGTSQVRLRFVGIRHRSRSGNIGIDNIVFTEGCIREDLEELVETLHLDGLENSMAFAQTLDPYCIFVNEPGFTLSLHHIMFIVGGATVLCICATVTMEHKYRKRRLKIIINSTSAGAKSSAEVRRASAVLRKMGPWHLAKTIQKDTARRVGSVTTLAPISEQTRRNSVIFPAFKGSETRAPNFAIHRNKSTIELPVASNYKGRRNSILDGTIREMKNFAEETGMLRRLQSMGSHMEIIVREKKTAGDGKFHRRTSCGSLYSLDSSVSEIRNINDLNAVIDEGMQRPRNSFLLDSSCEGGKYHLSIFTGNWDDGTAEEILSSIPESPLSPRSPASLLR